MTLPTVKRTCTSLIVRLSVDRLYRKAALLLSVSTVL